jgi:NitT/TauT family transport system permease protein
MIRRPISWQWHVGLGVASVLLCIALYGLLSYLQHKRNPNDKLIPTYRQIFTDGIVKAFTPESGSGKVLVWEDTKSTFGRLLKGLAVAALLSMFVGILMGCYAPIEAFFLPPLSFLAKIPPTAALAIFFVTARSDPQFFLTMMVFGLFPTMAQSIYHAAKEDVPEELLFKARTLGASQIECIYDVIYKHILPKVLESIRLQIGPAIVYLIAAELLVGDVGLGCRMRILYKKLDMSIVYVYLMWLALAGFVIDSGIRWVQRKLCPWYST